ncbi:MAG: hypothetical protein ABI475_08110 [Methylophilaceae bacterium]
MKTLLIKLLLVMVATTWTMNVMAKLPELTPEEILKKQADAEKKAASEEAAKAALAKAQDSVNQRYRATHKNAPPPVAVIAPAAPATLSAPAAKQ